MGVAAAVGDLAEDNGALVVHALHNGFPRFDLLLRPDARLVWESVAVCHDARAFCDEKPAWCGALCVVDSVMRLWDAAEAARSC